MHLNGVQFLLIGVILGAVAESSVTKLETDEEVRHLIGEPDFRDVALRWEYESGPGAGGDAAPAFLIHYCEMQAWGPHRCRTKVVEKAEAQGRLGKRQGRSGGVYTAQVQGLRMATAYSFQVKPLERDGRDLRLAPQGKSIIVPTKGFSARATQCLPHASEVEVSTGPYFGGRIAVEAADGGPERCAVQGNPASAQDAYTLRIHHDKCGSEVNETTVATYIIVQENLPILTHSTRRFLVLCTHKPDTLTVRAGINLPRGGGAGEAWGEPAAPQDMDYNELQPARLEATQDLTQQDATGEITLVVFLIMAAFGGLGLLAWRLAPRAGDRAPQAGGTAGALRANRNNIDRFSDAGSVYSVTLSERAEGSSADDTSEA